MHAGVIAHPLRVLALRRDEIRTRPPMALCNVAAAYVRMIV
jgi:hypothetical protein